MKGIKKLLTGILAGAMALSLAFGSGSALKVQAEEETKGTLTVKDAVEGEEYSLYKLLDFQSAGDGGVYVIKTDDPWYGFFTSEAKTDANPDGVVELKAVPGSSDKFYVTWANEIGDTVGSREAALSDQYGVQAFAQRALKYAAENDKITAVKTATGEGGKAVFKDLELGYYLVSSSVGALVSLDTTNKDATVVEKNEIPTSEKKVEEDSSNLYGDRDDAEIGQVVNFKSTITIPAGGAKNVVFYDKMTEGLTFAGVKNKEDKVVFKVTEKVGETERVLYPAEKSVVTPTEGGKYVEKVNGQDVAEDVTFTVAFDEAYTEGLKDGAVIIIEYQATVNGDAVIGPVDGDYEEGNDNKSKITYGNGGKTEWDWTRTFVYGFRILKHNKDDQGLEGAKFNLFRGEKAEGNAIELVYLGEEKLGADKVDEDGKPLTASTYRFAVEGDEETTKDIVTPKSGYVYIDGLDGDTYSLKEIEAPEGYNLIADPITVQVRAEASTQYDLNTHQNQKISYEVVGCEEYLVKVLNKTGVVLPTTGGMGTTIFYIIGAVLVAAGVAYFILRRKVDAE